MEVSTICNTQVQCSEQEQAHESPQSQAARCGAAGGHGGRSATLSPLSVEEVPSCFAPVLFRFRTVMQ